MELSILSSYSLCYSIINGGNTGVLKHASNVQGCAFAIEDAFIKAGFPRGVFMNLNVESKEVKTLIENKILPRSR
jgi:acyl-CoA reductase-like NAD-dependent aldehyde dehydrogenase